MKKFDKIIIAVVVICLVILSQLDHGAEMCNRTDAQSTQATK